MAKPKEDTPLLKQYFSIKAQNPEAVLLFRVGDFYESYSDDALITSKVLGIVLTRKSNGEKGDTPMAGIPHHARHSIFPNWSAPAIKSRSATSWRTPNSRRPNWSSEASPKSSLPA